MGLGYPEVRRQGPLLVPGAAALRLGSGRGVGVSLGTAGVIPVPGVIPVSGSEAVALPRVEAWNC